MLPDSASDAPSAAVIGRSVPRPVDRQPRQWSHQTDFDAVNGAVINFRAVGPRLFHGGSDADDRATYGWRGIKEHRVA